MSGATVVLTNRQDGDVLTVVESSLPPGVSYTSVVSPDGQTVTITLTGETFTGTPDRDFYERIGRQSLLSLTKRGEPDDYRRIPLLDDALAEHDFIDFDEPYRLGR